MGVPTGVGIADGVRVDGTGVGVADDPAGVLAVAVPVADVGVDVGVEKPESISRFRSSAAL